MGDKSEMMYYGIMAVAAIVMIWSLNKHRTAAVPWGRPVAGIAGLTVVAVAFMILSNTFSPGPNSVLKRFEQIQYCKMFTIGEMLAKDYPGAEIIIVRDFMPGAADTGHEASLKALKDGMKNICHIVGEHPTTPEMMMGNDPESPTSGPDSMSAFIDKAVDGYDQITLVLVLSGYPINFTKLKYPERVKSAVPPKIILAGGANHLGLAGAFESKLVGMYVVDRRNLGQKFDEEEALPKDMKELFTKRFEVITPDNYKALAGIEQ
jgi:hypothetical protein